MTIDYPTIWAVLVLTAFAVYTMLDGFDLGVGILHFTTRSPEKHDLMMGSVLPFWDGNETWLVLAGGSLYAIFPYLYHTIIPLLSTPIMLMLFSLMFRGICFEFRFKTDSKYRWIWRYCFALSSLSMAFWQGVIAGSFLQGFNAADGYSTYNWFTFATVISGVATILLYGLLGATWLWMKLPHENAGEFRVKAVAIIFASLGLWIYNYAALHPVQPVFKLTLLTILAYGYVLFSTLKGYTYQPFLSTLLLVVVLFVNVACLYWPYAVPFHKTIWDVSSPIETQRIVFYGAVVFIPVILSYTIYVFYLFHGKVHKDHLPKY